MSCQICFEENKTLHSCSRCSNKACVSCIQSWLLTIDQAKCFSCPQIWEEEFLSNILPKKFLSGEYKERIKKIAIEADVSLFSITQTTSAFKVSRFIQKYHDYVFKIPYAEMNNSQRQEILAKTKIYRIPAVIDWFYKRLSNELVATIGDSRKNTLEPRHKKLVEIIDEKLKDIIEEIESFSTEENSSADFFRCPYPKCLGFVQEGKCLICSKKSCGRCWEKMESDDPSLTTNHICKDEDVDSVFNIKRTSKKCPKCQVQIYKNGGCNHMICLNCKLRFNWTTGTVLSKEEIEEVVNEECSENDPLLVEKFPFYFNKLEKLRQRQHVSNTDIQIKYLLDLIPKEKYHLEIYYRYRVRKLEREEISLYEGIISRLHEIFQKKREISDENIQRLSDELQANLNIIATKYNLEPSKADKYGTRNFKTFTTIPLLDQYLKDQYTHPLNH